GRRVAALWGAGLPDLPLRLGVRRPAAAPAALRAVGQVVPADLDDERTLRTALAGVRLAINAVGPYAYDPRPLLERCAAAGTHYVDLASEPLFLRAVRGWTAHRRPSIAVCPGASTIPG